MYLETQNPWPEVSEPGTVPPEDLPVDPFSDPEAPLRRARITWASQIDPEPVTWAWQDGEHGRIPAGSLSMAAGREGTGKSSFGMWLAAQITRGVLPGHYYRRPLNVLYVALEDSWKFTLVPRLMTAGADRSRVGRFDVVNLEDEELTLSLPADNRLLEDAVTDHDVALVVIDPLMSVIGERIDTHREREVRSALDPLAKIADRTGCVILGIAHFNKGSGTDAAALITGSGAFKNVPRSIFGFARDESDDGGARVMSQVKNSLGRDDLPSLGYLIEPAQVETPKGIAVTGKFTFTGETDRTVTEVLREARLGTDPEETSERDEATEWLLGYLDERGGQAPAGEAIKAAAAVGIAKRTLTRARNRAGVISAKAGMSGGWVWSRRGHEEAEEARNQKVAPTASSLAPSHPTGTTGTTNQKVVPEVPVPVPEQSTCTVCGHRLIAVEAGQTTHPGCEGN